MMGHCPLHAINRHNLQKNIEKPVSEKNVERWWHCFCITEKKDLLNTPRKLKFSIKDFLSKCDQILNGKLHLFV